MNKLKIFFSITAILSGAFMFVYGEFDDSPGGQVLGVVVGIAGVVGVMQGMKKNSKLFFRN
jgi:hypothetical protein